MAGKTALAKWIEIQVGKDGQYGSLRDMAEQTGIHVSNLSRWKNGQRPTDELFDKLAEGVHLEPWQLKKALRELDRTGEYQDQLDEEIQTDLQFLTTEEKEEIRDIVRRKREQHRKKSA